MNGSRVFYLSSFAYLYWLLLWISFIKGIGLAAAELRNVSNFQRYRSKPKKMKHRKVRRPRLPFFRRSFHCKYVRKKDEEKPADDWESEGTTYFPYWKYLHLSVLPNIWEEMSTNHPELLDFTIGSESSFASKIFGFTASTFYRPMTSFVVPGYIDASSIQQCRSEFRFQSVYQFKISDSGDPILFDSGASVSLSPHKEDFINFTPIQPNKRTISGISTSPEQVLGTGTMKCIVYTDTGYRREILTEALYVPTAQLRILSVCKYQEEHRGEGCSFTLDDDGCRFTLPSSLGGGTITFNYRSTNYIPTTTSYTQQFMKSMDSSSQCVFNVVERNNLNLSAAQKSLLKLHYCLGHFNLAWIQNMIRKDILKVYDADKTALTSKDAICFCQASNLAKATRKNEGVVKQSIRKEKDGALKREILRPGACVSTDQFVSSLPVSLGAAETIRSKHAFERDAIKHGVMIHQYRGDNGVYQSNEFKKDLQTFSQHMDYCGVGAHHQNGVAERGIRTVSEAARAMMIHALIHWPEEVSMDLWPFAIKYAVYLYNKIPRGKSMMSPEELFYDTKSDHSELASAKVFGCPTYVLDPRIQDGKKIPRWNPRSKMGQFLGRSDEHASSIGLIRNLKTGKISTQFHCVYDCFFNTVTSDYNHDDVPVPPAFHDLFKYSRENFYDGDDLKQQRERMLFEIDRRKIGEPKVPSTSVPPTSVPSSATRSRSRRVTFEQNEPVNRPSQPSPSVSSSPQEERAGNNGVGDNNTDSDSDSDDEEAPIPRYSFDAANLPTPGPFVLDVVDMCILQVTFVMKCMDSTDVFLIENDLNVKHNTHTRVFLAHQTLSVLSADPDCLAFPLHPIAFAARANAADTPTYREAMNSEDREQFVEAMKKEMDQLTDMDAFVAVPRQKAIDMGRRIIECTWAFKRKRFPDGSLKKHKARLCVRGDLQTEGVDYFDTYSPVVQWSTIRLLLIMSCILNLETKQVDFTLAFVHAKAEPGSFIEMPKGFELEGYVLELKRNLYGSCDAPLKFYEYLKRGLTQRGVLPSQFDPCLFKSEEVMIIAYVDDCIFFSRKMESIDTLIEDMKQSYRLDDGTFTEKFIIEVEEDYAGFLGIDITRHDDGRIELTQTGLIQRILDALGLDDETVTLRTEPAATKCLGKEENSPPRKEHWSYPSVIGMLLYLSSNSRPDITFAVNQAAPFTNCARLPHEKAVKRIGRYLKVEKADDPISVRSRTGFVVTLAGLPVSWSSKLQTEIATSTMMAEYIALSTGMRELLPLIDTFNDICDSLKIPRSEESRVVRVFEDNEGALKLASKEMPRHTPQSKHFAVKYHWFRSKLKSDDYEIKLLPIDTSLQKSDIMTKGLGRSEFPAKRKLLMGW
ncbi:hypothetical protein CTEN210_17637 [Chaetoceros tenuissimus]|uniref:Integrase catalytic domain-containing protein n=1 Tax=Chaetoceros tenuissimus TaxID=426638 RepID=A0AAD3DD82_9STRA|nr:hypothetical protein CTEN210_17637 [Chaetoceros tenuissimus]